MFPDDGGIAHFEPVADVHPPGMALAPARDVTDRYWCFRICWA